MQLSFDPSNTKELTKIADLCGLTTDSDSDGADVSELKRLVESLRETIKEKNLAIAELKKGDSDGETVVLPQITETTFAACILNLDEKLLLKWPAIGKGGLEKMREKAQGIVDLADDAANIVPNDESTSDDSGDEESASTADTSEDDDEDMFDEDDGSDEKEVSVDDLIEALHKVSADKGVAAAKKVLTKYKAKKASQVKDRAACLKDLEALL